MPTDWDVVSSEPLAATPPPTQGGWNVVSSSPLMSEPKSGNTADGWNVVASKSLAIAETTNPYAGIGANESGNQGPTAATVAAGADAGRLKSSPPIAGVPSKESAEDGEEDKLPASAYAAPIKYGRDASGKLSSTWDGSKWVDLYTGKPAPTPQTVDNSVPGLEKFGGVAPGVPSPLPPSGLQSDGQQQSTQPVLRSRTGSLYQTPLPGQSVFDSTGNAVQNIVQGAEQIAGPASRGTLIAGGTGYYQPPTPLTPEDARQAASGISSVVKGGMALAAPAAVAGLAVAPVSTLATLGAGAVADIITQKGLKAAGVSPEYADLAGTIASVLAGYGVAGVKLAPEQQTLLDVLKGGSESGTGAAGAGIEDPQIDALRNMVDRGGTLAERQLAQEFLKRKFGVQYGPADLSTQAEATPTPAAEPPKETAPPEPTAPVTQTFNPQDVDTTAPTPPAAPTPAPTTQASSEVSPGSTFTAPDGKTITVRRITKDGQVAYSDGEVTSKLPMDHFRTLVGLTPSTPVDNSTAPVVAEPPAAPVEAAPAAPAEEVTQPNAEAAPAVEPAGAAVEPAQPPKVIDLGGMGAGIADNMHDMLWQKVQSGDTTESGQKSALLQAAALVRQTGGLQTPEEFRSFALDYSRVPRGADFQQGMRALVQEYASAPQPEPQDVESPQVPAAPSESTPVTAEAAKEPEKTEHEFSSTQANITGPVADAAKSFAASVPDNQLAPDGRSDQIHTTALYGIHGNDSEPVRALLADQPPITITLGKASVFSNPDGDVVKVDVDGPDLHILNATLKTLPHTSTFPEYRPHVTLFTAKPGMGAQYEGQDIPGVTGQQITLNSIAFSGKDGKQVEIPLTGKPKVNLEQPVNNPLPVKNEAPVSAPTESGGPDPRLAKIEAHNQKAADLMAQARKLNPRARVSLLDQAQKELEAGKALKAEMGGETVPAPAGVSPTPLPEPQKPSVDKGAVLNLRKTADGMQAQIDAKLNPGSANQNPTARRARIAGGMIAEGGRLERVQKGLRALADLHEKGEVPEILKGIRSRSAMEDLLPRYDEAGKRHEGRFPSAYIHSTYIRDFNDKLKGKPGTKDALALLNRRNAGDGVRLRGMDEINLVSDLVNKAESAGVSTAKYAKDSLGAAKRLYAAGINEDNFSAAQQAIEDLGVKKSAPTAEQKIKAAERDLLGTKIEGYFPTPKPLAERLVAEADIKPGMVVLEPSAGNGAIADEMERTGAKVFTIEPVDSLRAILDLKGHKVVARDFTGFEPQKDRDAELREDLGVNDNGKLSAYDPADKVQKLGNKWTYTTLQGNSQGMYDTKREATEAATAHIKLKREQYNNPEGYRDIVSTQARKHLELIKKYEGQGMTEMEAAAKARQEIPELPPVLYDRIVMNPPFERGQDVDHVRHAFDLLKPGGKLVAIMGEHGFFGTDKKSVGFRDWLEENGGTSEKLPSGSFTGKDAQRQTGVAARVVVIDKPTSASSTSAPKRSIIQPDVPAATSREAAVGKVPEAREPAHSTATGSETTIRVPGTDRSYKARYAVRELADVHASHNPYTFQVNPKYQLLNDRNYADPTNSERIVNQVLHFDPEYLLTNAPDSGNGAPVIDPDGNVLGGNSRTMTLDRVYRDKPQGAEAYRTALTQRAAQFGIDPSTIAGMKQPVLVREIPNSEWERLAVQKQQAVTDLNKTGTASLTAAEKATSDARALSPDTAEYIAGQIEATGPTATLADALSGRRGVDIVNRLIHEGVFSAQEKPDLIDSRTGAITAKAKDRISKALLGQFFRDSDQMQRTAPELRNKLERIVAPLTQVQGKAGWDLLPDVRQAVDLLEYARARGIKNLGDVLAQGEMFGSAPEYGPKAVAIAAALRDQTPTALTRMMREYAIGSQGSMFETRTPEGVFADIFGSPASLQSRMVPGFYSQLQRTVESKMPGRATPQQIKGILDNPQNGVKPDERKWTGVDTWLEEQKGSVSKQQVMDFLKQNEVRVDEVMHNDLRTPEGISATKFGKYVTPGGQNYRELLLTLPPKTTPVTWKQTEPDTWVSTGGDTVTGEHGRFEIYDLSKRGKGFKLYDSVYRHTRDFASLKDAQEAAERGRTSELTQGQQYKSSHWEEPNVLAHVRFDDRTVNGEKVLHVAEVQSDWHQEGKRNGYSVEPSERRKIEVEIKRLESAQPNYEDLKEIPDGYNVSLDRGVEDKPYTVIPPDQIHGRPFAGYHATREDAISAAAEKIYQDKKFDQLNELRRKLSTGVPAAPFSKSWAELAFRRVLRYAAENGYDRVSWDTGATNADRYDLSKHLDELQWDHNPDGSYDVIGRKNDSKVVGKERISAPELENFVGKEMAQKIIDKVGVDPKNQNMGRISGLDLKVGGHGMAGFYDKILPDYANRYGKKWGAKVETIEIPAANSGTKSTMPEADLRQMNNLLREHDMLGFETMAEARGAIKQNADWAARWDASPELQKLGDEYRKGFETTVPAHSIAITPAMRKSVMEGQPLFAQNSSASKTASAIADLPRLPDSPVPPDAFNLAGVKAYWGGAQATAMEIQGTPALLVNNAGMDIVLNRMSQLASGMDPQHTVGLALRPFEWRNILAEAKMAAKDPRPGGFDDALVKLAAEITKATAKDPSGPVLVLQTGARIPEDTLRTVAQEELDHAAQMRLPTGLAAQPVQLLNDPLWQKAQNGLLRKGYKEPNPKDPFYDNDRAVIMAEIGVRLMRGRYNELTLTAQEARDLAGQYAQSLVRDFGDKANEIVNIIAQEYPEMELGQSQGGIPQSASGGQSGPRGRSQLPEQSPGLNLSGNQAKPSDVGSPSVTSPAAVPVQAPASTGRSAPSRGSAAIPTSGSILPDATGSTASAPAALQSRTPTGGRPAGPVEDPLKKRIDKAIDVVKQIPESRIVEASEGPIGRLLKQIQGTLGIEKTAYQDSLDAASEGDFDGWRQQVGSILQQASTARAAKVAQKAAAGVVVDPKGTPRLTRLRDWFKDVNPDGSKNNYSGLGAFESKFVRNLGQTADADPDVYRAALLASTPKAQAAVAIATAHPVMKKELEKSGLSLADFYLWGARDRLMGLQDRWNRFADQAEGMKDPEDIKEAMDDEYFGGLLQKIAGKRHIAQDVFQTATAAIQQEDWDTWSQFVANTFRDAADAVDDSIQEMMPDDTYDKRKANPNFQEALRVYQDRIAKPMAQDHARNDGVFSDALGPSKTYFPLVPADRGLVSGPGRRLPWKKPRNQFNQFATGLSEEYLTTPESLKERLTAGFRANTKAALIKATDEAGLSQPPTAVDQNGSIVWQGKKYATSPAEEVSPARTIIQHGKVIHVPATMRVFPNWFHAEMQPILEGKKFDDAVFQGMTKLLMEVTLSGPAEAAFHMANLTGAMVSNTPFLGTSLTDKAISVPLAKRFAVIGKVLFTDPTTDEAARDLQEMAKLGIVPSRYGSVTYSKKYAEELGAKRSFTLAPLLFGPEGFDVRARLLMYRIGKAMAAERGKDATPYELNTFVNQLGNYTSQLQGSVERTVKSWPFAQFFTAGSTMIRNGLNSIAATSPVPGGNTAKLLGWKLLTGMAGLAAMWIATHEILSGSLPWKDRRSKFLSFPVGGNKGLLDEGIRRSAFGRRMWGEGPETGYIGMGFFNPLVARAGRAIGVADAYNTAMRGGSVGQDFEGAERDILNTWSSPLLGPPIRFATVTALGVEPYLSDFRSRSGSIEPHAITAIPPNSPPGIHTLAHKAVAATVGLNAFYNNIGEASGLASGIPLHGSRALRMVTDLAIPGLFQGASNPESQAQVIHEQQSVYRRPEEDGKRPPASLGPQRGNRTAQFGGRPF